MNIRSVHNLLVMLNYADIVHTTYNVYASMYIRGFYGLAEYDQSIAKRLSERTETF